MSQRKARHSSRKSDRSDLLPSGGDARPVFGIFLGILLLATFLVSSPWAGFHAVLLAAVALLVLIHAPSARLPKLWWILAGIFLLGASTVFLPAAWFPIPAWRSHLEGLGVHTGQQVVIQSQQAFEQLSLFAITLFIGLWLAGHRPSQDQLRLWSLMFVIGVATYAVASRLAQNTTQMDAAFGNGHFGFFPNRNHSATYLAMGSMCGLGCVLQALRDKRFAVMAAALVATGICLWAVAAWSISRGGVVLVAIGCLIWLPMLGRHYLGRHGLWAIGLFTLTATGLFFIADSGVKERISLTLEKAEELGAADALAESAGSKSTALPSESLDFRIPTALDTLGLIREFKWTGIGAGQYRYIFPQYRNRTAIANEADNLHPESDWLWMAAETGLPATLALASLVLIAAWTALRSIRNGRNRALRSACLVAAMLVAIHGIFDVPGHRITLALSAALLFALSLPPHPQSSIPRPPNPWIFRIAALPLFIASAFLINAQWFGGPQPAGIVAQRAHSQAIKLSEKDQSLKKQADSDGSTYDPAPADDPLEQALQILQQSHKLAPMGRTTYHLEGVLALHFDDKDELVRNAFAIERALDPTWINAPMLQANAWSHVNPDETVKLWNIALQRARELDASHPKKRSSEKSIQHRILTQTRKNPSLEKAWLQNQRK